MSRDAHGHRRPASRYDIRNGFLLGKDERQRARPETCSQSLGCLWPVGCQFCNLIYCRNVNNEWIIGRPALGREDPLHRFGVASVGSLGWLYAPTISGSAVILSGGFADAGTVSSGGVVTVSSGGSAVIMTIVSAGLDRKSVV